VTRRKTVDLELSVETITPEIALQMLEANTRNRRLSDRLISIYAQAIKDDEWRLNGEPIIFDYNGTLQSGQHRLLAVIEAGVPIRTVVVRGAEPEGLFTLDSGRKRKLTDALNLLGEKDVANLSGAITWTWRWENQLMDRTSLVATTSTLLRVLDTHPSLRDDLVYGRQMHSSLRLSAGLMAAVYHQLALASDDVDSFWETACYGESLDRDNPVYAWRRFIVKSKLKNEKTPSNVYAAVTVKAWNAWIEHRPLSVLRWAGGELFPTVSEGV
jgi:hypothetical protein